MKSGTGCECVVVVAPAAVADVIHSQALLYECISCTVATYDRPYSTNGDILGTYSCIQKYVMKCMNSSKEDEYDGYDTGVHVSSVDYYHGHSSCRRVYGRTIGVRCLGLSTTINPFFEIQ